MLRIHRRMPRAAICIHVLKGGCCTEAERYGAGRGETGIIVGTRKKL